MCGTHNDYTPPDTSSGGQVAQRVPQGEEHLPPPPVKPRPARVHVD